MKTLLTGLTLLAFLVALAGFATPSSAGWCPPSICDPAEYSAPRRVEPTTSAPAPRTTACQWVHAGYNQWPWVCTEL